MAIIRKTLQPDLGQETPIESYWHGGLPEGTTGGAELLSYCEESGNGVHELRWHSTGWLMCYFSWGVGHGFFFLTTQNLGKPLGIGFHQKKLESSHEPIRLQKPRTLVEWEKNGSPTVGDCDSTQLGIQLSTSGKTWHDVTCRGCRGEKLFSAGLGFSGSRCCFRCHYPLVNIQKAIENGHL